MANEFKIKHGFISTGDGSIEGALSISGAAYADNGSRIASRPWVSQLLIDDGYATTDDIATAISNLVDSAPGTLDTLNELAAALGDDPNFVTTVTNSIATKLPLAGGTMSGNIRWTSTGKGLEWVMNTDGAGIKFYNTGDSDTNSRLEYYTTDNENEYHRFMVATNEEMTIKSDGVRVTNNIYMAGDLVATQSWVSTRGYGQASDITAVNTRIDEEVLPLIDTKADSSDLGSYLPLTGGTVTGRLIIDKDVSGDGSWDDGGILLRNDHSTTGEIAIAFDNTLTGSNYWINGLNQGDVMVWAYGTSFVGSNDKMLLNTSGNLTITGAYAFKGGSNTITDTKVGQWNTAYGWGDHTSVGYLTSNPTLNEVLTQGNSSNGTITIYHSDYAFTFQTDEDWGGWARTPFRFKDGNGDHFGGFGAYGGNGTTLSKYFIGAAYNNNIIEFHTNGSVIVSGSISADNLNVTNWDTAYEWGNHASAGYLTSYTETDTLDSVADRGATTNQAITTGGITSTYGHFGATGSNPQVRIYTENASAAIADTFTDTTTDKSYIYFMAGTNSNDPGYIMHETSEDSDPDERNEGVLHLVPSDDNNTDDYVSIHGTNDPDALKLHTNGLIQTSSSYQLQLRSGSSSVRILDDLSVQNTLYTDSHGNSSQWNTAYGWGNHASAGYITASDSITGNAATATKLATARNIALSGAVTGSANFDGSANITISTTATSDPTLTLAGDASGSATFTNLGNATLTVTVANDSHTHDGRYYTEAESDARFVNVTGDTVTGDLAISGATLSVTSTAEGTEAFFVDGVNGRLFTISDDLSDSLFSANTISGLPVIEAFADNTVKLGPYSNPVVIDSSGILNIGGLSAATESYVDTAVNNLIGGAPGALDTLNELAAAINDNASYASSVTTALGLKAPLASPALTGTPTAPTQAASNNSTRIATTAFVKAQGYSTTDTNYYLNGISKSGNTLTFSVSGTTNQTYTFGSAAWAATSAFDAAGTGASEAGAVNTRIDEEVLPLFANYQASGNYFTDGDTVLNMANDDGLVYNDTNNLMYVKADGNNYAIIDSRGGSVNGTLSITGSNNIAMSNGDITGVNQITINDPGEGIIWQAGSSGNITLAVTDDASDNILNLSGTGASLAVNGATVATQSWVAAQGFITSSGSNYYVDGLSFDTGNGILTASVNGATNQTVDLDGRYQLAGSYLTTSGKAADSELLDGINSSSFLRSDANDTMSGVLTITGNNGVSKLRLEGTTPTIDFDDSDGDSFYIHVNSNRFYILSDRDGGGNYGNWETPHPLYLDSSTNETYLWGNLVGTAAYQNTSAFDAAGSADAVNLRIDEEVIPSIPTNNNQLTNGAGYITDGNTGWNNTYGFITSDISSGITINGEQSRGTYASASNYKTGADNIVLKGNSVGRSGIFFESEKDGTNINHASDFGFIQYHAYGTSTSGESNELIIGVSNDTDDHLIFNAPNTNGMKFRIGASTTDNTVYHSGNLTLATLGYTGAANANYITNNNQLTNGAGYITSADGGNAQTLDGINSTSFLRSDANDSFSGNLTATANDWYIYGLGTRGASAGAYGIGNRADDTYRQMTFHVPNQAAYSSSGTVPSFGFYSNGAIQLMKLNSDSGNLWLKGTLEADGRIYADNGLHVRGDWVRVNGSNGIYFESHGGGWSMTDSSWIRAYNNKGIYTAGNIEVGGTSRADTGFKVGGDTVIDSNRNINASTSVQIGNYIIRHDSATNRLEFVLA